jgi:hypothetical protein
MKRERKTTDKEGQEQRRTAQWNCGRLKPVRMVKGSRNSTDVAKKDKDNVEQSMELLSFEIAGRVPGSGNSTQWGKQDKDNVEQSDAVANI